MKKYLYLLFFGFVACSGPQDPIFKRMENLMVTELKIDKITIRGDALYYNPNGVGGNLVSTDINVIANEVEVGKVTQTADSKIEAKSEFAIPVEISFPPSEVFKNEKDVMSGLFNALLYKKLDVRYEGQITISILGIDVDVPVEYEDEVEFKKK